MDEILSSGDLQRKERLGEESNTKLVEDISGTGNSTTSGVEGSEERKRSEKEFQSSTTMAISNINNNQTSSSLDSNHNNHDQPNEEWIKLNVGGRIFTTTRTTLCTNEPNSMLARMFSHLNNRSSRNGHACHSKITLRPSPQDNNGAYLIDRSPEYFEPILNYMRHGKLIIDHNVNVQGVLEEAKFYGIVSLLPVLELETERLFKKRHHEMVQTHHYHHHHQSSQFGDEFGGADGTHLQTMPPLTRQDVINATMSTSASNTELRFQGINLAGANLSKLDLRHINFKYANLRNANLKLANLSYANLERADLYQSNLEGALLTGANLSKANLENSNLRAVTVEGGDPGYVAPIQYHASTKPKTSFEGANLKNTNFEGSRLVEVNLRVANIKGSNLQNCDLRGAVLTGADLENCDLSGSDLNEANLRNANIKGARFEFEIS